MRRAPLWSDGSLMASEVSQKERLFLEVAPGVSTENTDDIHPVYVPRWQGSLAMELNGASSAEAFASTHERA